MNRGTALKWADRLDAEQRNFSSTQMRYTAKGREYLCPLGVLVDFLDSNGWTQAWDGVSYLWHEQQFHPAADDMTKTKMKCPADAVAAIFAANCRSHAEAAKLVREHYEIL